MKRNPNNIDLKFEATNVTITPSSYSGVIVDLENASKSDLDDVEIAKCVSISNFIEAWGEDTILDYFGTDALCDWLKIDRI